MCVCVGAVCGQSDASAEVYLSLEESSTTATFCPAGLHEDAGESWTSAHIQTEGRLDRPLQVESHTQLTLTGQRVGPKAIQIPGDEQRGQKG